MLNNKVILVTGALSGMGKLSAQDLNKAGHDLLLSQDEVVSRGDFQSDWLQRCQCLQPCLQKLDSHDCDRL